MVGTYSYAFHSRGFKTLPCTDAQEWPAVSLQARANHLPQAGCSGERDSGFIAILDSGCWTERIYTNPFHCKLRKTYGPYIVARR